MNEQMKNKWIEIICKMYKGIHNSDRVMHVSKESENKTTRMLNYFNRLEEIHKKVSERKNKNAELLLKSFYYELYVIKPENIKESYFQSQIRLARERGYGNIILDEKRRKELIDSVIEDQKQTLDKWIEYFLYDEESKAYEMWEKYWVFQGLQSLGKYDKESGKFTKRDETTVYPFPPVEREYIFTTINLMEEYIKNQKGDEEIRSALGSGNFKKLYEYVIKQSMLKGDNKSITTRGKWVKYDQGSDYKILRDSLQGYYTGWCTAAGENFAKSQLENGDFYVYYTEDQKGEAKIPRIAIRMDGKDSIGEIRGIVNNQNMEPEMMPILEEKLKEFPDSEKYMKKEHDMKLVTIIDKKIKVSEELTIDELRFLYEIDSEIEGFGYAKDPRIDEIKATRNKKRDYASIFNAQEDEVAISADELQRNPQKFKIVLDDLLIGGFGIKVNEVPKIVIGSLRYPFLEKADESIVVPKYVFGSAMFSYLKSARNFKLPEYVGGDLDLFFLESVENVIFPKKVGENLDLHYLTSVSEIVLPEFVGKNLRLDNLESADNLLLPNFIGESLMMLNLESAKNLKFPETIGGGLFLYNLENAENLIFPKKIGGNLNLQSLTSASGLTFPEILGGYLDLSGLKSAEGLLLPYNFDLDKLICSDEIKNAILMNKDKYFRQLPTSEEIDNPLKR